MSVSGIMNFKLWGADFEIMRNVALCPNGAGGQAAGEAPPAHLKSATTVTQRAEKAAPSALLPGTTVVPGPPARYTPTEEELAV